VVTSRAVTTLVTAWIAALGSEMPVCMTFWARDLPGNWYVVTQILRLSVAKFRATAPRIRFYAREDPRTSSRATLASLPRK
jgi:hypothetical protein